MKAKRGRCLALVAVLAMVVCAFAVAMPAGDSDAADSTETFSTIPSSGQLEKDKYYYVSADTKGVKGPSDGTAYVVVKAGCSVTMDGTVGGVKVYYAKSATSTQVTFNSALELVGVASQKYAADASAEMIVTSSTGAGTGSVYGVLAVDAASASDYKYYPEGASVTVSFSTEESEVSIVDGSAVINGVYTAEGATTTTTKETITATNVVAAKADAPVAIKVSTAFTAVDAGQFTVSGGDSKTGTTTTYTTGSISIDKNNFAITGDDAAKLVKVVNGYFVDSDTGESGLMYAKAGTDGADVSEVDAVCGTVGKPSAALSNSDGVMFINATVSGVQVGSADDYVTLTITGGTVTVKNGALSGIEGGTIALVSGAFTIEDNEAEATAGGDGTETETEPAVPYGATVTVMANASLELTGATEVNGKLLVYGELTATNEETKLTVEGEKDKAAELRAYTGSKINSNVSIVESGDYATVDISGAQKVEEKRGSTTSPMTYVQTQIVELIGDYEITGESAVVVIYGALVIPEGFTLSITDGASVYVAGSVADVEIEGALTVDEKSSFIVGYDETPTEDNKKPVKSVEVTGSVSSEGTLTINSDRFVVESGAVVDSDGTFVCGRMTVGAGGTVYLTGEAAFAIWSAGTVVLDGVTLTGESGVAMTAAGATVSIEEATLSEKDLFMVTDQTIVSGEKKAFRNGVEINAEDDEKEEGYVSTTFSGMHFTVSGTYNSDATKDTRSIDMSGAVEAERSGATGNEKTLLGISILGPGMTVKGTLAIGAKIGMEFYQDEAQTYDDVLTVSGVLDVTEGIVNDDWKGTLDVTGMVMTGSEISTEEVGINAVYYKADSVHCYITLAAAVLAEASTVEVLGEVVLTESLDIPSGMTVKVDPTAGKLFVGTEEDTSTRDVVLTFEDGAKATGKGEVDVYGTLVVENLKDFKLTPKSDVVVTDTVSATYTNIYTALANAEAGDVVEVTSTEDVELDADITVAEGVTLKAGVDKTIKATKKITITVNGAVVSNNGIAGIESTGSTLKIAGEFLTAEGLKDAVAYYDAYGFAGAYFDTTDSTGTWMHITALENAVEDAAQTEAVYVYGKVTVGDLEVTGTAEDEADIHVENGAVLTAGTVKLKDADLNVASGARFSGTVSYLNGSVELKDVGGIFANVVADETEEENMALLGDPVAMADGAYVKVLSGTVRAGFFEVESTFDVDITVAEGATLDVMSKKMTASGKLLVQGTLNVDEKASLEADAIYITGSLVVDPEAAAGALTAETVYVGYASSDLGAAASLTAPAGGVDATTIYVAAGSTVSADAVKDMKHTAFYVEGTEKFTVYNNGTMKISEVEHPEIAGAEVDGWDAATDAAIGDVEKVEASIDYTVYKLSFVADYGFADIFLDGAKVASVSGGQVVYIDPYTEGTTAYDYIKLKAGTHTIEYTLKSGYSGDKATTAFDGKEFSKSFSITTDMDWKDTVHKVVLTGVTQAEPVVPEQQKKDNTVTDALLIVLVVLIAIMAIMVALKLMRS